VIGFREIHFGSPPVGFAGGRSAHFQGLNEQGTHEKDSNFSFSALLSPLTEFIAQQSQKRKEKRRHLPRRKPIEDNPWEDIVDPEAAAHAFGRSILEKDLREKYEDGRSGHPRRIRRRKAEDGLSKREREEIRRRSRKLKDASVNLAYARMAVRFVEQKVALVANWDESVPSSAENIYRVGIDTARSEADRNRAEASAKAAWNKADQCVYGDLRQNQEWQRIDAQTAACKTCKTFKY
jgi:hypothetical protein